MFLARDVIYTSRSYAVMSVSVCDVSALAHPNLPRIAVAVHAGAREGMISRYASHC